MENVEKTNKIRVDHGKELNQIPVKNFGNFTSLLGRLIASNIVPLEVGLPGDTDSDSECILAKLSRT
jgi:hypothetical protein